MLESKSGRGGRRGGLAGTTRERVLAHIEGNLGARVFVAELAKVAGLSRCHFVRQFRVATGESPMRYMHRRRIERAKTMLATRDARIAAVAAGLGFADQSHFTRIFGRIVGVTPKRFAIEAGAQLQTLEESA